MTCNDDVPEMVSAAEIAAMADVSKGTVGSWKSRGQLPEPHQELGSGPIWTREVIERWLRERRR